MKCKKKWYAEASKGLTLTTVIIGILALVVVMLVDGFGACAGASANVDAVVLT